MNNIETKTFIRGTEASSMSDADIFKLITRLEGEAEVLGKIKVKSVKVAKAIADLNEDVQTCRVSGFSSMSREVGLT